MQTDKYTKVILTLIAIGLFSLGCSGGASLEEVNELRQEIAALKEAVEQNEVEELRLEVAALRDSVDRGFNKIALKSLLAPFNVSDMVRTKYLEIVNEDGETVIYAGTGASGDGLFEVKNGSGKQVIYAGTEAGDGGDGQLSVSNKSGQRVIYAGTGAGDKENGRFIVLNKSGKNMIYAGVGPDETGGYISIVNKTGEEVVTLGTDGYGNGVVGAWNRKGKGRTLESK